MIQSLREVIDQLGHCLRLVESQPSCADVLGRILSDDVLADRNSPAADVSAMDGYAIRVCDLKPHVPIAIYDTCAAGMPPPILESGSVVRIFTGAVIPDGCDAVVKREDTEESPTEIRFLESAMATRPGENIRRSGENAIAGSVVAAKGTKVNSALMATLTNFGAETVDVFRRVRVAILTTGDEVGRFDDSCPAPWQLRNSNQSAIRALLSNQRWIEQVATMHVADDRHSLRSTLQTQLSVADVVLFTGGVSKGDHDYVPEIIRDVGAEVVFHGLPIRPGKPILGAVGPSGELIMGLPGNPVSALIGCHRFGLPLMSKIGGQRNWHWQCSHVRLHSDQSAGAPSRLLPLFCMPLVDLVEPGLAKPVLSQGSGDLVSLGQSSGYVEIPPNQFGEGPWPYYSW